MYDPSKILTWVEENVKGMRQSRRKTLASIVGAAMRMQGGGVLALGRSMVGPAYAKHRIKRVDRFLGNDQVETDAVSEGLFDAFRPRNGHVVVLVDWTDRGAFQQLVLALPREGRALPFYSITVKKSVVSGEEDGEMVLAEQVALHALERMCKGTIRPVIIADRGFGNSRWLQDVSRRGWYYVQRIARNHYIETESYTGIIQDLGIRRGYRPRDHGWGTLGEKNWGPIRLVSVFQRDAKEPWFLLTNIPNEPPAQIVRYYQRRMWIEAMFRDLKNREWGLGTDTVRLTRPQRYDRHFIIIAIAYILLTAFGAVAERTGLGHKLKANTVDDRVLSLARIGNYYLQTATTAITCAVQALLEIPT